MARKIDATVKVRQRHRALRALAREMKRACEAASLPTSTVFSVSVISNFFLISSKSAFRLVRAALKKLRNSSDADLPHRAHRADEVYSRGVCRDPGGRGSCGRGRYHGGERNGRYRHCLAQRPLLLSNCVNKWAGGGA